MSLTKRALKIFIAVGVLGTSAGVSGLLWSGCAEDPTGEAAILGAARELTELGKSGQLGDSEEFGKAEGLNGQRSSDAIEVGPPGRFPAVSGGKPVGDDDPVRQTQVLVMTIETDGRIRSQCGGTMIKGGVVLTAAHCLDRFKEKQKEGDKLTICRDIKKKDLIDCVLVPSDENHIQIHPDYKSAERKPYGQPPDTDLALLKPDENQIPAKWAKPAKILLDPDEIRRDQQVTIVGAGTIEDGTYPPGFRKTVTTIAIYVDAWGFAANFEKGPNGVCSGDSGSGAFLESPSEPGIEMLVAITARGGPCGDGKDGYQLLLPYFDCWFVPTAEKMGRGKTIPIPSYCENGIDPAWRGRWKARHARMKEAGLMQLDQSQRDKEASSER